jgi:nitrite reductase/ring-hydroxylating ferredoxin subunit
MGADLSNGELRDGTLTCAWHGWCFDVASGRGLTKAWARLKTHLLLREGEDLVLEIREPAPGMSGQEADPPPPEGGWS